MKKKSFTLVEMLVVLAIIAILVALLLPILIKVKHQAKKEKARNAVTQIAAAWSSYLNDYRSFPTRDAYGVQIKEMTTNVMNILAGGNENGIIFMEISTNDVVVGGWRDPWGTLYQVSLDNGPDGGRDSGVGYDGVVTVPHYPTVVKRSAVSWSKGVDMLDNSAKTQADDVKSWE